MKDLSLSDAFRYFGPGAVALIVLGVLRPALVKDISLTAGAIGLPLLLPVVGSLVYALYRPVFDIALRRLFSFYEKEYHEYLRGVVGGPVSPSLWRVIQADNMTHRDPGVLTRSANIHLVIISGLSCLIGAGFARASGPPNTAMPLFIVGILLLVSGLYSLRTAEKDEFARLRGVVSQERIRAIAMNFSRTEPASERSKKK